MDDLVVEVERVAAETGFSGVVRVDHGGANRLAAAIGFAHRGLRAPIRHDTQFAIASGGKGLTALAVVSLIAEGILALETTARSVLGDDLPLIAEDVTVEHLLAHRSGIGDYLDEEDEPLDSSDYVLKSPVHLLTSAEAFLPELDGNQTKFTAGQRFSYCNGGYMVLAVIAERVTGVGYHELVEKRVIQRADLVDTAFLRSDEPSGRMALGYLNQEGHRTNVLHLPVKGNGDGGIYTTAPDMHQFWTALMAGRIVPDEWVAEMTRSRSHAPKESSRYGLGFWLGEEDPTVNLVGGDAGVSFYTSHDPTAGATWTVISNTSDGAWPIVRLVNASLSS